MINEILGKIEKVLNGHEKISKSQKEELLKLVEKLKKELNEIAKSQGEKAKSVAAYADLTVNEILRKDRDKLLQDNSLGGLKSAIRHFEISHPELIKTIDSLILYLNNLGL